MQVRYDEDLVEAAVLALANSRAAGISSLQVARFHREREKLYSVLDPDDRNARFFKLNVEWFREWGLEANLLELVRELPLLEQFLSVLVFRKARARADEGAELYVTSAGIRNGALAVKVAVLLDKSQFQTFSRHELLHLSDMLDPAFAYEPELHLDCEFPQQHRLALERYRLIWDVSIDGRLEGSGKMPLRARHARAAEFQNAFCFWPENRQQEVFENLWTNHAPSHNQSLTLIQDPRGFQAAPAPGPGAPCPLCGFPTFDWAPDELLREAQKGIQLEFRKWSAGQGACGRCARIYKRLSRDTVSV